LRIKFGFVDVANPQSPLLAEVFEWAPILGSVPVEGQRQKYVQILWEIKDQLFQLTWVPLLPSNHQMARLVEQWPWIFCHCISMHDTYPKFLEVRAALLVKALPECVIIHPSLLRFKVPVHTRHIQVTDFSDWIYIMGPVTSLFKTSFELRTA
jgi:hypothetical protein